MKHKHKKRTLPSLIVSHLRDVSRALLDGEKRPAFLEFLKETNDRRGLYALYDKRGRLYYVGKAIDLPNRLNNHLGDKHSESWERMSLFFVTESANVPELEGLMIATAKPPGNRQKPKIGKSRRKSLKQFLKGDANLQIDELINPDHKKQKDKLSGHITPKKLRKVSQSKLASVLGITQARVSQLLNDERKVPGTIKRYIRESGRRDGILLLLQKSKK